MYPITKGYDEVKTRLDDLLNNNHDAEALLASVFVFEKTTKRIVRFSMINRGLSTSQSDELLGNGGFEHLKKLHAIFHRDGKKLHETIDQNDWAHVTNAVTMRNKIVHGERVYKLSECRAAAEHVRRAIDQLRNAALQDLQLDPWTRLPSATKSKLPWLGIKQPIGVASNKSILD